MDKLKCVGVEFYGYNHVYGGAAGTSMKRIEMRAALFPSLKTLSFYDCPALIEWKEVDVITPTDEKAVVFPCLEGLTLWKCRELRNAPNRFPSLQKLFIHDSDHVMPIENICSQLTTLTRLKIGKAKELSCLPVGMLEKNQNLRSLLIGGCEKLSHLPDGLHTLCLLEILEIVDCPKLTCISIHSLTSLRGLHIENCGGSTNLQMVDKEFSLDDLTSYECNGLKSILISGLQSCTSLHWVHIINCQYLRHLPVYGLQTLVSLEELYIKDCTNLEAIPSLDNLTSLAELYIEDCTNLEAIPSLDHLTSLRELFIRGCDGLTSLPRGIQSCTSLKKFTISKCHSLISLADVDVSRLQSLSNLEIFDCRKLKYLPTGLHSLSLERMKIGMFWEELDSFPDFELPSQIRWLKISGWPKLKSLPQQIQHLTTCLQSLFVRSFDSMEAFPEWLGDLTSLISLRVKECKNLMYLPTVEVMERLTKLSELDIDGCPHLVERCAKESGPEWHKIWHIPDIIEGFYSNRKNK
ncbi:hypothetical protein ACE6H2_006669 [Prunus campanulata]